MLKDIQGVYRMNLKDCQVFTPKETVIYMLDLLDYRENIFEKTIIDNSCGNGNFLVEIVRRFIIDANKQNIDKRKIKNSLENCIFGCDVDSKCVDACIENLNKVASGFGYKNIKWNISKCDGLYYDDNIKFDYVVGNPPYISYLDLDEKTRVKTKEKFQSCSIGKFDYSYAFIEKGLQLLKINGKMAMITPANMFKTVFAENLREIIKTELTYIIDCSSKKIFDKVLTTPAITIYEKGSKSHSLIYREISDSNEEYEKIISKDVLIEKWNFTDYISAGNKRFGDSFKASNCIATLANKIFIHDEDETGKLDIDIESNVVRVAKSPRSEQFGINQKIIFPYYYENGELKHYSEKEMKKKFPKTMSFLNAKKDDLLSRNSDENAKWYEYGRSQALRHINQKKLLFSTIITKKVRIYELDADIVPYSGIYVIPKDTGSLDEARLILQSKRFYNYLLAKGVKVSGDSIRISSKDVEEYRY